MTKSDDFGFIHEFIYSSTKKYDNNSEDDSKKLTLLMLHGTGGTEEDLISIGKEILPSANILSPRGKVSENGMSRFFRRFSEGVFDIVDLKYRTNELADFVQKCSFHYKFDLKNTIAIGFSNGANIAVSILFLRPEVIQGAILFRAMIPFIPDILPDLSKKRVLLSAGLNDPIVSKSETENLYQLFKKTNADIILKWQYSSHNLIKDDLLIAKEWIL